MEIIPNDQYAPVLAERPPNIVGWNGVASERDPLRLHPGRNPPVRLVISIGRESAEEIAELGAMLSQEI